MKSVVALIVALALAFGAGPLCAAPAAASMKTANMECGDRSHHHGAPDVARVCHACLFAAPAIGTNLNAIRWDWIGPEIRAPQSLSGLKSEPPTPPPRQPVSRSVSILSGEYT